MESKYYIPTVEEFHIGFEYEMKERFGDGTVKTQEDYNNASWIKLSVSSLNEIVYINRTITGINPHNHPSAIRVKYLDKEDIESLGFEEYETNWFRKKIFKEYPGYYYIIPTTFYGEHSFLIETDMIILSKEGFYESFGNRKELFNGVIKNKSELKVLLKQIKII